MEHGHIRFGLPENRWKRLLIPALVIGVLAVVVMSGTKPSSSSQTSSSVSTLSSKEITCLGRLLPGGRILRVAAPPRAIIQELLVQRGQWVERGDILVRLRDYARETAVLHQAEKEVVVAESALNLVRAGEKSAAIKAQQSAIAIREAMLRQEEAQYERSRKLYEKQVNTAQDFEDALTRRDTARASLFMEQHQLERMRDIRKEDLSLAASKLAAAEAARKVAQENVELNIIRSPVSGRVLDIHAFAGEAVQDTGLLDLGSGKEMLAEAEVYVSDIGRVRIGAPATVTGDAFSGTIGGHVVEISPMVQRSTVLPSDPLAFSDLRIVNVWIHLDDPGSIADLSNHQVSVAIQP